MRVPNRQCRVFSCPVGPGDVVETLEGLVEAAGDQALARVVGRNVAVDECLDVRPAEQQVARILGPESVTPVANHGPERVERGQEFVPDLARALQTGQIPVVEVLDTGDARPCSVDSGRGVCGRQRRLESRALLQCVLGRPPEKRFEATVDTAPSAGVGATSGIVWRRFRTRVRSSV